MAAVINPSPAFHRKPVAGYAQSHPYQQAQQPVDTSSNTQYGRAPSMAQHPSPNFSTPQPTQAPGQSRRTLSNATSSTSSTSNNGVTRVQTGSAYAGSIRRSTSSRSNGSGSPTSYVALMRKQKATVWCDRAQHQDARILAAQRQAKMRAVMEVAGGHNHNPQARASTSSSGITSGVRSKIRHHGAPKAKDYNSGNLSGAGVPMRLSATEVDEGESDDDRSHHQRGSSSRSSLGSARYGYGSYRGYDASPPNAVSPVESMGDLAEEETPMPEHYAHQNDYFGQTGGTGGSGSSGEAEQSFGRIGGLPQTTRQRSDSEQLSSDELRRRGSVDDRTMTMSGVRLFVANPDLSD